MTKLKKGDKIIIIRRFTEYHNGKEAIVKNINGSYILVSFWDKPVHKRYQIELLDCEVERIPKKP